MPIADGPHEEGRHEALLLVHWPLHELPHADHRRYLEEWSDALCPRAWRLDYPANLLSPDAS